MERDIGENQESKGACCARCCLKMEYSVIIIVKLIISLAIIAICIYYFVLSDKILENLNNQLLQAVYETRSKIPQDYKDYAPKDFIPKLHRDSMQFNKIIGYAGTILI